VLPGPAALAALGRGGPRPAAETGRRAAAVFGGAPIFILFSSKITYSFFGNFSPPILYLIVKNSCFFCGKSVRLKKSALAAIITFPNS
jgi:hypothetical protein